MTLAAAPTVVISEFQHKKDNQPVQHELTWLELLERLSTHAVRARKDGPGWSPTVYQPGTSRAKDNVELVTALVLDFDHCEPPWAALEPFSYVAHTTFSHKETEPAWRVVIQLARLIPARDWPAAWARAQVLFGATADRSCKDCSRFFYLPTCREGAPHHVRRNDGVALDPDTLPALPPDKRRAQRRSTPNSAIRPYAQKALDEETAEVAAAAAGGRNSRLNSAAYSLGQLVGAGELPRALVEELLENAAQLCGLVDDDGLTSVQRTIRSGLDAGEREPRQIPVAQATTRQNGTAHRNGVDHRNGHSSAALPLKAVDYHLTDLGNARRLVAAHGEDLHYSYELGFWLAWDGCRWSQNAEAIVQRHAKDTVARMYVAAADLDDDERRVLVRHALRSESHAALQAMIACACSEPDIPVSPEDLDPDPWLLNVRNGTLDLRTGQLLEHRREDLISKVAPVAYAADAECPTFLAFLGRIMAGNLDLIGFIQRAIGYSLTGNTRERALFVLYGTGRNGKSTLLGVLDELLGDYAKHAPTETLLAKRETSIPNDVAQLRGARLVSTIETEEGARLAEAKVKALVGRDPIPARFMRGEWFSFVPDFKPWLATNHKPVIRGTDPAIWDRIRLIPFLVRIPVEEEDKELADKLRAELPGILAWAVRGCLDWQEHGLAAPSDVVEATGAYRAEMDTLAAFLADCCVLDWAATVPAKALYEAYKTWCEHNGEYVLSQKALGLRLQERGFDSWRNMTARGWSGIGLLDSSHQYPPAPLAPVCEGCNRPASERLGELRTVNGHMLHDNCALRPGASA